MPAGKALFGSYSRPKATEPRKQETFKQKLLEPLYEGASPASPVLHQCFTKCFLQHSPVPGASLSNAITIRNCFANESTSDSEKEDSEAHVLAKGSTLLLLCMSV